MMDMGPFLIALWAAITLAIIVILLTQRSK